MLRKPDTIALGLCFYFIVLACIYAAVTPAFEAPDEASHFLYVHNLLETGQLPILEDRQTISRENVFNSQSVQRHHPPLYYLIGALLISGTERKDLIDYLQLNPLASIGVVADNNQNVYLHSIPPPNGDTATAIWILRLYSIALGAATVLLIYHCAYLVTGDARTALLAALLVISIPTFIHISASINNDNLVTFLYAAGVYLCLRTWHKRQISLRDIVFSSLILSAIALTKINGLTLFVIIYGSVMLGTLTKRFQWRQAAFLIVASLIATILLAGWWYWRNAQLYGDPLALNATLGIWGRGGAPHLVTWFEAKGIWESFWLILGHFNIRGPDWFYDVYLPIASLLAVGGLCYGFWRDRMLRLHLLFLICIALLAVFALLITTSRINVSQGRILYPGLAGFVPLCVIGWRKSLGFKTSCLIIMPLALFSLVIPFIYIAPAYARANIVDAPPTTARMVNISTGQLTVLGYELLTDTVQMDNWVRLNLYVRGSDSRNPYLFVKALYPLNNDVLGGVDEYPGMMPTQSMDGNLIYSIPIRFRLDNAKVNQYQRPYQIRLTLGWRALTLDHALDGLYLPLFRDDSPIPIPMLEGPTVLNTEPAPPPENPVEVTYGDQIRLSGITLSTRKLIPGQSLAIQLNWQYISFIKEDWTVAVGLLSASGQVLATADGPPAGYPTSAWRTGPGFVDTRTLNIPPDASAGSYSLYIGWYRFSDGLRLEAMGDNIRDNLYVDPVPVIVCVDRFCKGT